MPAHGDVNFLALRRFSRKRTGPGGGVDHKNKDKKQKTIHGGGYITPGVPQTNVKNMFPKKTDPWNSHTLK